MSRDSSRDARALVTLVTDGNLDDQGVVRAPIHALGVRSGLSSGAWKRALRSLEAAAAIVVTRAGARRPASYRVAQAVAQSGPGNGPAVAHGGVGGALALALVPSALPKEEEQEPPEEPRPVAQPWPRAVAHGGPGLTDAAVRYLADAIREGLAALAAGQPPRAPLVVGAARSGPDPRGWTAEDCAVPCPLDASHGPCAPRVNGLDGSRFGRCASPGCEGRFDPAVAQRSRATESRRMAAVDRKRTEIEGGDAENRSAPLARSSRRNPLRDPRRGDVVEAGGIARRVTGRDPDRVAWQVVGMRDEAHDCALDQWQRWGRTAEVRAFGFAPAPAREGA